VKWLLQPENPLEREARWLAILKESEEHYGKIANGMETTNEDPEIVEGLRGTKEQIHEFRINVEAALPKDIKLIKKTPSLRSMAEATGEEHKYYVYAHASQYVHGTAGATEAYRRNLGAYKQFGERISSSSWRIPLLLTWYGLGTAGVHFLHRVGGDVEVFLPGQAHEDLNQAVGALRRVK
jgi:hypothetical protein